MGMKRSRVAEKEKTSSWLLRRGLLQGKWKDYTVGKSRKRSKKKQISQSIQGGF
jgi:hypothetical protein